jgi:NADH-quinone oxidoreductase subunit L
MEGPTPVSALIHAATMVTAGVYLIARMFPLFELAPTAADIGAFVGLATLLIAATIALVVTDLKRIIAYSTMSQIGYMVMGVSIGAYAGGLFLLMAHAFFKALLFMAAGSVISAMANNQNIDRMSGFRRAMPFTSALLIVGCLALAAFPGTSGFFAKDEILGFAADRGGMYWIFAIGGYVGALMTAFYSFRIGFRVVAGKPSEEARELEGGHMHHAEPTNPQTGEPEDTGVGYPGPEHHIAEREWPMRAAMAVLGVGALFGGLIQVPGVDEVVTKFLEGTFESSSLYSIHPSTADAWIGLAVGGTISVIGIAFAYLCYVRRPGITLALAQRYRRLHDFLLNKWYFDELQNALVYRPIIAIGQFANSVFERRVVQGIVDGASGVVKGAGAAVRGAQSGFVRAYALLLVGGFAALGVYFLVVSS